MREWGFRRTILRNAGRLRDTREEAERRCGYNGRCAPYAAIAFRPAAFFAWHGSERSAMEKRNPFRFVSEAQVVARSTATR